MKREPEKREPDRLDGTAVSPARSGTALNRLIVDCQKCPRLIGHCQTVARVKRAAWSRQEYWGQPVPNFGDCPAPILIVGLAPGAHGANRTGRMFTGDRSGDWLYRALHRAGLAELPTSVDRKDGNRLMNCLITAVCHCAPPDNKPALEEIEACRPYLEQTFRLCQPRVVVALGRLAWDAVLRLPEIRQARTGRKPAFGHAQAVEAGSQLHLIGSYHPSQQNTFTGRLTEPMLDEVFALAVERAGLDHSTLKAKSVKAARTPGRIATAPRGSRRRNECRDE